MMIGFEVAPVAPLAAVSLATRSGSTESSHSLVPDATSDCSGVMGGLRVVFGSQAILVAAGAKQKKFGQD